MRIRPFLAVLLAIGLLIPGCGLPQRTGPSAAAEVDAAERMRLGTALFVVLQQRIGGTWALDPALGAYVSAIGTTLARLSEHPEFKWEFALLDQSAPGAWALPGGKIAITRGLLVKLDDEAELAALLALAIEGSLQPAGIAPDPLLTGAASALVEIGPVHSGAAWQQVALRTHPPATVPQPAPTREDSAIDEAVRRQLERAGYAPLALADLLQHLAMLAGEADRSYASLAVHHASAERAEAAQRNAQKPGGGERGDARFHDRIARLRRDSPAYAHYDRGLDALESDRYAEALAAADAALRRQPREALFHELQAVAASGLQRPAAAFTGLNRAIALNPGFFRPHLLRGLLHLVRGNLEPAAEDLLAANRLLPSVEATLGLAEVARGLGDTATARARYAEVAGGDSAAARFARKRIAQLSGEPVTP